VTDIIQAREADITADIVEAWATENDDAAAALVALACAEFDAPLVMAMLTVMVGTLIQAYAESHDLDHHEFRANYLAGLRSRGDHYVR